MKKSSLLLAAALLAASWLPAAETGTPSATVAASTAPIHTLSLDFPGGPLATFLANANREGAALNVVGEKSDLAIDLPPMSLRNADSGAVASALSTLLQPRGFMLAQSNLRSGSGETVWVLRKLAPHEFQMAGLPQFQSFQLAPFLESQTVDDIIGAIRAAWELDPAHAAAALKLKFHPPTGILLVSAPTEGIFVVQSVLQQLRRAPDRPPAAKTTPAPSKE